MYRIGRYNENDLMSNLICDNYPMLLVMSRFNIALGIGDLTIGEVCAKNRVDTNTFLAIVNLLIEDDKTNIEFESYDLSITSLISYLKKSHQYFVDFRFPAIRKQLVAAIGAEDNATSFVIIKYFDEYVNGVCNHMEYEEKVLFSYIDKLMSGKTVLDYNIDVFCNQHTSVDVKLSELKNIIIKYYVAASSNELNSTLFDVFSCAQDLLSHNDVENYLLAPLVRKIEQTKIVE